MSHDVILYFLLVVRCLVYGCKDRTNSRIKRVLFCRITILSLQNEKSSIFHSKSHKGKDSRNMQKKQSKVSYLHYFLLTFISNLPPL